MKRISFWVIAIGCFHIIFAAAVPVISKFQIAATLARNEANEYIDTAFGFFLEEILSTLIHVAIAGVFLIFCGVLILKRIRLGWKLLLLLISLDLILRGIEIVFWQVTWPILIGAAIYGILLWKVLQFQRQKEYELWWGNRSQSPNPTINPTAGE